MRQNSCLYSAGIDGHMNIINDIPPRKVSAKLSADDILYLQRMLLIAGFHHIMVPNLSAGRTIMCALLRSMHCFARAACLTQDYEPSLEGYDLLEQLKDFCGHEIQEDALEEYFLEEFEADFLWIEINEFFIQNQLVRKAIYIMQNLDIARKMPVVAVTYKSK